MDRAATPELSGVLQTESGPVRIDVLKASPHTLMVKFPESTTPPHRAEFPAFTLIAGAKEVPLGRVRFHSHAENPARRKDDPPLLGDGKLVFLDDLYDFSALVRSGAVFGFQKRLEQLPVLFGRKKEVRPEFREFVSELVYDLQVYRGMLDEVDRALANEPFAIRADVHRVVTEAEYPSFRALFDEKMRGLEAQVKGFTQEEHERHGFYLRKHVWDIIRASEFLLRTNLKPRGYAGDSEMMKMMYENDFRGTTLFARFMHRHPLQDPGAQAVRNRVSLLAEKMISLGKASKRPVRVMSVAAGPAWELKQVLQTADDLEKFELALLDQDPDAIADARAMIAHIEERTGRKAKVRYIQESVRTMLRTKDLVEQWGNFDFLYSMGLFDYLTAPVAKVVLAKLFELLKPGGELVIGNFHVDQPTRVYAEYWMDWVLTYRTEEDLLALTEGLEGSKATVAFEDTRSQMFLTVRKETAR